jgi:NodT family efflux transporter outer membrane factor (OMF) lipoprotein
VRSGEARLRQARASRDLAVANLYPSLSASAGPTRSRSGGTSQTLYDAGFDARWEPSIFGGLTDAADAAQADAAAAQANLASIRASLAAEVALEYINLRLAQQRLAIVRANVVSQTETLRISEWREMAGLVTRLDVEQARANLEQSRATQPGLEVTRAGAEHRLSVLTGRAPGRLREILQEFRPLPAPPEGIAVGIPSDTLRQRPDVRAAEFALRAEIARTAQSEAERYPDLTLSGSFGWRAVSLSALGGSGSFAGSLAASLAASLFDAGRIESRVAAQTAVQEQAFIAWEKSLLVALEDVENALAAYAHGHERVDARRLAADAAANAAELARAQYQAGLVDFQRVLETERTRLSAEDSLASAEAEVLTAVVQLYKALGGGWTTEDRGQKTEGRSVFSNQ